MNLKTLYVGCMIMFAIAACQPQAFPAPDPTAAATPTSAPSPTLTLEPEPTLLSQVVTLTSVPFSEAKDGPVYKITAQIPQLQGMDDARVTAFNARVNELVTAQVDAFRSDILVNQPVVPFMAGSSIDIQYELIGQRGEIWSIKFSLMSYLDGAAHPNQFSITLNYDLASARELALDDLFLHGVNHLPAIASYCQTQLTARAIGFDDPVFRSGAEPTPENYRNWNLSDAGLVVTFDPYQVAPYAAGTQTVVIPYAELLALANPGSALEVFGK